MLAMILAEVNRDRQKHPRAFTVYDFHPLRTKPQVPSANWKLLKEMYGSQKRN